MIRRPPRSPLFPSPTLSRSLRQAVHDEQKLVPAEAPHRVSAARDARQAVRHFLDERIPGAVSQRVVDDLDRKSTRLNSSHSQISYAVFCLNKKKHESEHCQI